MPLWAYIDGGPTYAFVASASGAASWSTALGTATPDRIIIVCAASAGATAPTGCTVDGVAATLLVDNSSTKIWGAAATANVSGTTTLTGGSSPTLQGIGVYALYGLPNMTPAAIGTGISTATVAAQADGFIIGCGERTGGTISTWTGLTKDYTATVGGNDFSSASATTAIAGSQVVTTNLAGSLALAAWGG